MVRYLMKCFQLHQQIKTCGLPTVDIMFPLYPIVEEGVIVILMENLGQISNLTEMKCPF